MHHLSDDYCVKVCPTQIAAAMVLLASQNVDSLDVSMHISA